MSSDPICGSWFPKSVFPSLNLVSVHAISLLVYLDCRFFRNCLMCLAVIVVSLSLERQFVGEWSSLGVACLWSMVLYFPDPFLILLISDSTFWWVCFFCGRFISGIAS